MSGDSRQPSTAHAPDLDWSQVRETVRMLHLAVAQIEMAMREGDDSINALTDSFTTMIGSANVIATAAAELPDDAGGAKAAILDHSARVTGQMHGAVVAFQFYDKLSQRLGHVSHSLESLAALVGDHRRLFNPYEWRALQQKIRSQYSMQEEQDMFDALLGGAGIAEALRLLESRGGDGAGHGVELF